MCTTNQSFTNALTPVVLLPGGILNLSVEVDHQTACPECPPSGSFTVPPANDTPYTTYSQICQDQLLTLAYDPDPGKPMPQRFSDQPGVKVTLPHPGKTENMPAYEGFYTALEAAGYQRNRNIRVASFDARLSPDLGGFLERTIQLIEETCGENDNLPVHLVGHSSGPVYAQYLLTHTSQEWKDKYIHGLTSVGGCFPGQGWLWAFLLLGLNISAFNYPTDPEQARSSVNMLASWPMNYIFLPNAAFLGDREVNAEDMSTGKVYTPQNSLQLLEDAGLGRAREIAEYYIGFVKFADPASFPNVDVYAEIGTGIDTTVGVRLASLQPRPLVTDQTVFIKLPGDSNQEDITNRAVMVWQNMSGHHFEMHENPGVEHMALMSNPGVLGRLLAHLKQPHG